MAIFFTADTHFCHKNIRTLANRPFDNDSEMEAAMIFGWNARVKAQDTVYALGDIIWGKNPDKIESILTKLTGEIHLIRGNHDSDQLCMSGRFASVSNLLEVKVEGYELTLCHYPMLTWKHSHYGALMLHGHSHGTGEDTNQRMDVGVDNGWGFRPRTLGEIRQRMSACKPHSKHDHHVLVTNDFEV